MSDEEKKKAMEAKKAELKARLAAEAAAAPKKGGFMTPERKKKLRTLLRQKAAEELKKEQERKAAERKLTIETRCGQPKDIDKINDEDALVALCEEYNARIEVIEGTKYDAEWVCKVKQMEIAELTKKVNELRGKYMKPPLKKVSKSELTFAKMQAKEAMKANKPDWTKSRNLKKAVPVETPAF